MGRPVTLLERLCEHVLSFGAESIMVESKDRRLWIFAFKGGPAIGIANFADSSSEAKELRESLRAACRKPVRTALGARVSIIHVRVTNGSGKDVFEVKITPLPKRDPSVAPSFTAKQGQYLAFIYHYTKIHRQAPAESDLERYFQVSAPSIHEMIKTLHRSGLIERTPGEARSIQVLVAPQHLPPLE